MRKVKLTMIALVIIAVMVAMAVLPGCKTEAAETTAAATTAAAETTAAATEAAVTTLDPETAMFAYVLHVAIPFTESIRRGAMNAAKDYGVKNMEVVAPSKMDTMEQIGLFDAMVQKGVAGLGVVSADAAAWTVPINNAVDKGILVATGNVSASESKQTMYCGISGYADGISLGNAILNSPDTPKKGLVVVASCLPGLPVLDGRTTGLLEVLKTNPDYTFVGPLDSGLSPEATYAFWETAFTANPDMVMAVGSCAFDLPALYKFKQKNTNAKFYCVSYDLEPDALKGVKEGILGIAQGQGPYLQGYMPMAAMFENLIKGNPLAVGWINPGAEVVDKNNVDEFMARELDAESEYNYYKEYIEKNLTPIWEKIGSWDDYKA